MPRTIDVEGYTLEELLAWPAEVVNSFVFTDESLTFCVGTARVLGAFRVTHDRLVVELGHIDRGGEGVLVTLAALCARYARINELREIEWLVHGALR